MILALDLGTHTGVAYGAVGDAPTLTTWRMPSGEGADVGRFACVFEQRIRTLVDEIQPSWIGFEAPFLGPVMQDNMDTARRILGLPIIVEMVAHKRGIDCQEYHIGTARKAFTGSGSAKKFRVWQTARARGFAPETEHEADACCVWWNMAHERYGAQGELLSRYDPLFIEAGKA